MNLYLISQTTNDDYDTYDSAVVVAANEEDARHIHPSPHINRFDPDNLFDYHAWAHPKYVTATWLATTNEPTLEAGNVICSSFNAG